MPDREAIELPERNATREYASSIARRMASLHDAVAPLRESLDNVREPLATADPLIASVALNRRSWRR